MRKILLVFRFVSCNKRKAFQTIYTFTYWQPLLRFMTFDWWFDSAVVLCVCGYVWWPCAGFTFINNLNFKRFLVLFWFFSHTFKADFSLNSFLKRFGSFLDFISCDFIYENSRDLEFKPKNHTFTLLTPKLLWFNFMIVSDFSTFFLWLDAPSHWNAPQVHFNFLLIFIWMFFDSFLISFFFFLPNTRNISLYFYYLSLFLKGIVFCFGTFRHWLFLTFLVLMFNVSNKVAVALVSNWFQHHEYTLWSFAY